MYYFLLYVLSKNVNVIFFMCVFIFKVIIKIYVVIKKLFDYKKKSIKYNESDLIKV